MSGFSARLAVNLKKELETWPCSFAYVYSAFGQYSLQSLQYFLSGPSQKKMC